MGAKKEIFKQKLSHTGYFKFADLYKFVHDFLKKDNGYTVVEDSYSEKFDDGKKEIEVAWKCFKDLTDYYKGHSSVKFKSKIEDVIVERGGKKEDTNKGNVEFEISAEIEGDYSGDWEKSPWLKFWKGFYDKYIIKSTGKELTGSLAGTCQKLVEEIKSYLVLEGKR
jgi:hypothetical protein